MNNSNSQYTTEEIIELVLYAMYLLRGDYKLTPDRSLRPIVLEEKKKLDHMAEDKDILGYVKKLTAQPPFTKPRNQENEISCNKITSHCEDA